MSDTIEIRNAAEGCLKVHSTSLLQSRTQEIDTSTIVKQFCLCFEIFALSLRTCAMIKFLFLSPIALPAPFPLQAFLACKRTFLFRRLVVCGKKISALCKLKQPAICSLIGDICLHLIISPGFIRDFSWQQSEHPIGLP